MKSAVIVTVIAVIAIALLITVGIQQPTGQAAAKKDVKVGAILALTGDFSIFGNALREGVELGTDELNSKRDIRYNLIIEDDGNVEIRKAVEASKKLIDIDKADVAMVTAANEGKSISQIFESDKTPLIVLFDSNEELEKGEYTFGIGFSTEDAAKAMAEYAFHNLSAKKMAIVYSFDDWSNLIALSFKKEFESLGGAVTIFEGTDIDEKDFRTFLSKAKKTDAIYAPLFLPSNFVVQSRELGYKGYVLTADSFNQDQIDAAGNAADGVYFTDVYVPESEKMKEFMDKYKAKYRKEPEILALTAIGYDAMHAIDAAVRAKGIGREQIKEGLYEIRIEGTTGTVDFDGTGMSPRFEHVFIVENGTAVLVE